MISLKKNELFRNVYRKGRSFGNRLLVMHILENGLGINRIGVSVSKKVGNSVVRHRISRLIKESYRLKEDRLKKGFDLVIVAKVFSNTVKKCVEIDGAIVHLTRKLRIWNG